MRAAAFIDGIIAGAILHIDCDGGSVTVWRKFGESALSVRFEAGERLKTGGSCGRRGGVYGGGDGGEGFPVGGRISARALSCQSKTM